MFYFNFTKTDRYVILILWIGLCMGACGKKGQVSLVPKEPNPITKTKYTKKDSIKEENPASLADDYLIKLEQYCQKGNIQEITPMISRDKKEFKELSQKKQNCILPMIMQSLKMGNNEVEKLKKENPEQIKEFMEAVSKLNPELEEIEILLLKICFPCLEITSQNQIKLKETLSQKSLDLCRSDFEKIIQKEKEREEEIQEKKAIFEKKDEKSLKKILQFKNESVYRAQQEGKEESFVGYEKLKRDLVNSILNNQDNQNDITTKLDNFDINKKILENQKFSLKKKLAQILKAQDEITKFLNKIDCSLKLWKLLKNTDSFYKSIQITKLGTLFRGIKEEIKNFRKELKKSESNLQMLKTNLEKYLSTESLKPVLQPEQDKPNRLSRSKTLPRNKAEQEKLREEISLLEKKSNLFKFFTLGGKKNKITPGSCI